MAGITGLLLAGGVASASAVEGANPNIDPPTVSEDAAVEPDSAPGFAPGEVVTGTDSEAPLEEDLALPGATDGPELGDQDNQVVDYCTPTTLVKITKNLKNTMSVKYSTFVTNNKSYPVTFRFSSKRSGTTSYGASVSLSTEFKLMWLGKVEATVTGDVQKSWTSELGVDTSGKVKAHSTVKGNYGIKKENVYGYIGTRYSNCEIGNKRYMKFWAPYREGWVLN
ncbi:MULTISPECIES: hypothetical protein [Streptomyces]|uniref:hypothetical protein n=1 Tax=Streptomyces TaxID=1883 RepID=UPI001E43EB1E|nr:MULTISPECIES: hypothetical protein [Streptomyces]UFQ18248.1 hypothetical protein J2N69_26420 [Streptomyces huasconensis]WCL87862.1 hypothetical protein PPN52_26420 [Streptomyces sp. JCM 35825]